MARKKQPQGLSLRQIWMLVWLLPLIGILLFVRQMNLSRHQQQSPGWNAIESVRTPTATGSVTAKKPSATQPIIIEKPVISGEPAAAGFSGDISNFDLGAVITEKISLYENSDWNYGFQIPYGNYWRGFGARDGASHSVGISRTALPNSFESSDIKVWYFPKKDIPLEGHNGFFQDPSSGKTYLKVKDDLFIIQAPSFDDKILGKIIETVYLK